MAYRNCRHYLQTLESRGELLRVRSFVSPRLEMAEVADRLVKNRGKAILFENNGTAFPVLMNAMGSDSRICMALGVNDLDEIGREIQNLFSGITAPKEGFWDKLKVLPSLSRFASWMPKVVGGRGDCQAIVQSKPDLSRLPVITSWPFDGGPFVTLPVVHTRDPHTGVRNIGMYRMQVYGPDTTGMHWHLHKNSARHYQEYKKLGKWMPVSVILGGDPVYTYVATSPMPDQVDEYMLAGFLRKKKVELVKCLTNDLEVPSDADFVIEGYVDPMEDLRIEGPFGDHTGFYSLPDLYPVFHVSCITHRKDAIYPATVVGIPPQEDLYLGKATERIFLTPIRMSMVPEIVDMHMPAEGVFHNLVLVKIRKTYPGQAEKVMNALWGAGQMMLNKVMIVLEEEEPETPPDESLSLKDYKLLFDKVIENFNPSRDVLFSSGPLDVLDHASTRFAIGGKMGIKVSPGHTLQGGDPQGNIMVIPLKKTYKDEVRENAEQLMKEGALSSTKLLIFTEEFVSPSDYETLVWRVLNNIDPTRDCYILQSKDSSTLVIDGTRKYRKLDGFDRPWPNCTVSDQATIKSIDEKWDQLGIGPILPSPSDFYKNQVYPGGAEAISDDLSGR